MRRVLVTGAGGLLGRHLVPRLEAECEIIAPRIDLSRPLAQADLPSRLNAVVYLAQSNRFRDFPDGARDMFEVNSARPLELLDHCLRAGATHFVYASTGGVYGTGDEPFAETAAPAPGLGFYPASKLAGELVSDPFSSLLNVIVLRFFFIYGPGQKRGMLVPRLVDSVREGRPVTLQGADGIRINPVHVYDAAAATEAALRLDCSATINVAGPEILSLRRMCETIGHKVGREVLFETSEQAAGHLVGETVLMRALLVPPRVRFDEGVDDCLSPER